jgi:allantoicase
VYLFQTNTLTAENGSEGHDWCMIQLATSGFIQGVDIDTNHFLGNHPPFASIEAANIPGNDATSDPDSIEWKEILPKSALEPGSHNFFSIEDDAVYTHLRLHIYPDGGVARLKVYGEVFKDWCTVNTSEQVNLAAVANGAKAILCNDMFFSHMDNLIMPGRGINMGDGWETKRNRTPENKDWVIVRLAHKGVIEKILIDTGHFKGNYPDSCVLEGCDIELKDEANISSDTIKWTTILPQVKLGPDAEHYFETEIKSKEAYTHVRLKIFPDGGVSRMRLWGKIRN